MFKGLRESKPEGRGYRAAAPSCRRYNSGPDSGDAPGGSRKAGREVRVWGGWLGRRFGVVMLEPRWGGWGRGIGIVERDWRRDGGDREGGLAPPRHRVHPLRGSLQPKSPGGGERGRDRRARFLGLGRGSGALIAQGTEGGVPPSCPLPRTKTQAFPSAEQLAPASYEPSKDDEGRHPR